MLQKTVKSVLNRHKKRDDWFLDEYSINPYEGCSCNCRYCYIRGSKYGENLEEKLSVKINAPEILEKQIRLRARKGEYGFVAVGSATDAYIPQEAQWRMTEKLLKVLLQYRFPVFISTKRNLILRDIDLLRQIDEKAILPEDLKQQLQRGLILSVSISTMDENIARALEPGALPPLQRLEVLKQLKRAGFLCGVNAIPLLPFISDTPEEMEKIIEGAKQAGADWVLAGGLTLFGEAATDSKTLYFRFIEQFYPELLTAYQKLYSNYAFTSKAYQLGIQESAAAICVKYNLKNRII